MNFTLPDDRLPVWNVLSEFFIDTELDSDDYKRIAFVLAASKYSLEEMEDILSYEVYPECKGNLLCIAGEWAGFHPDWISKRIGLRKDKRPRLRLRPLDRWMFKDHWKAVSELVQQKRNEN